MILDASRLLGAALLLVAATTASAQPAQQPAPQAAPRPSPEAMAVSIDDALRAAEPASEAIAAARADVSRAKAGVGQARSGWFPQVNGSASYTRTLRSEFEDISFGPPAPGMEEIELPFGQRNTWRLGVVATQPIWDGFRTKSAVDQAKAGVRASELGVKLTKTQTVLLAGQAYYDAALAQRQVEIAEVTLAQAEQTFADTRLSFQQGAAPEFDLVRAEVARDNQATLLVQFRAQRDVSFVALRRLIGVAVDRPIALTSSLDADDVDAVVASARRAAGVPAEAERAAVRQAKENVSIRQGALGVARSEYWPQLSAGTDFGLVDYATSPFNDSWRTNWTVGISLSVPLFDGLRRRAQVKVARADVAVARAQLADSTERAAVETAQADAGVAAALTTFQASARTVGQARRAYQIAELRFEQGASTHLELVDARVQLEQAQLNQARSARDLRVARLRQALLPGLPLGGTP